MVKGVPSYFGPGFRRAVLFIASAGVCLSVDNGRSILHLHKQIPGWFSRDVSLKYPRGRTAVNVLLNC